VFLKVASGSFQKPNPWDICLNCRFLPASPPPSLTLQH
jgi:hypothetical protein